MATLGKIRNRSGLLLAVIGFAMLAFILTDFMNSLGQEIEAVFMLVKYLEKIFCTKTMRKKLKKVLIIGNLKISKVYLVKQLLVR